MPYISANLPTVPYFLNVENTRLSPELIQGAPTLLEVASVTSASVIGDLASQVGIMVTRTSQAIPTPHVTFSPSIQSVAGVTPPTDPVKPVVETSENVSEPGSRGKPLRRTQGMVSLDIEQTVPYVDQTQRETPFVDFFTPVHPPVRRWILSMLGELHYCLKETTKCV